MKEQDFNPPEPAKKGLVDLFIEGARRGFKIGTHSLLPNVMMAYVIIRILDVTGLLKIIGTIFSPFMAIFGLPGEAATVIITSLLTMGGAIGVAVTLFSSNILDPVQLTSLIPGIYLMGNPIQNVGRCLGVSGTNTKHYAIILGICLFNTLASILAMRFLMLLF